MNKTQRTKIAAIINQHGYMSGVDRMTSRVKATGEVFTPTETVLDMIEKLGVAKFGKSKEVLEPACGDGQFVIAVFLVKTIVHKMKPIDAIKEITAVDIMKDNAELCRKRLWQTAFDLLPRKTRYAGYDLAIAVRDSILVGNTLDPIARPEGQSSYDHFMMKELFLDVEEYAKRSRAIPTVSQKEIDGITGNLFD